MPTTYKLPAGRINRATTLVLRSGDIVRGKGRGQTILSTSDFESVIRVGGYCPQVDSDNHFLVLDGMDSLIFPVGSPVCQRPHEGDELRRWGDGYNGVTQGTVAVDFSPAFTPAGGYELLGMNAGPDFTPSPFLVSCWPGEGYTFRLHLQTDDGMKTLTVEVGEPNWYSRHIVVWQWDCAAGRWAVWLDGAKVYDSGDGGASLGTHLAPNVAAPFRVGGGGGGRFGQTGAARGVFYGCRIDTGKRFDWSADLSTAPNDYLASAGLNEKTAADVRPTGISNQFGYYAKGYRTNMGAGLAERADDVTISDLTIEGSHFGSGIEVVNSENLTIRDVACRYSAYGLSSCGRYSQYPVTLDRVWLNGDDAAANLHLTFLTARGIRVGPGGRWAWVQQHGDTHLSDVFADDPRLSSPDGTWLRYEVGPGQPSRFSLTHFGADYEGNTAGRSAGFASVYGPADGEATLTLIDSVLPARMFERDGAAVIFRRGLAQVHMDRVFGEWQVMKPDPANPGGPPVAVPMIA